MLRILNIMRTARLKTKSIFYVFNNKNKSPNKFKLKIKNIALYYLYYFKTLLLNFKKMYCTEHCFWYKYEVLFGLKIIVAPCSLNLLKTHSLFRKFCITNI